MSKKEDILKIRNYFGKHDKTTFEHWAYAFLDELWNEYSLWENSIKQKTKDLKYYLNLPYRTVIEYEPDDNTWVAYCPELGRGSCYAIGETRQEAFELLEEAKKDILKYALDEGKEIPEPKFEDKILSNEQSPKNHLGYCLNCDCNCRDIETLKNLKGKFDDSFSMIEEREYKTVYLLIAALANIYNEDTNEIIDLLTGHLWDEEDAGNLKHHIKALANIYNKDVNSAPKEVVRQLCSLEEFNKLDPMSRKD